ncbi:MAG: DUF3237 domain-containing protein [Acidimicrobiales bacterium]|nr:DUF3237 domain-containing protein [Acidimicrobiales bacterium]
MAADQLPVDHLFTLQLTAAMDEAYHVRGGPAGRRIIAAVTGGTFEGPRLRGTVAPMTGADWVTIRPDKSMRLDVRLVLQADDGGTIYMYYGGIVTDGQARTAPYFETGDAQHAWLNNVQAVGIGTVSADGPRYEVYALR